MTAVKNILDKLLKDNDKALVNYILKFVTDTCYWCEDKSHCINTCASCEEKYCHNCSSNCHICARKVCENCVNDCCLCDNVVCIHCIDTDTYCNKYCKDC